MHTGSLILDACRFLQRVRGLGSIANLRWGSQPIIVSEPENLIAGSKYWVSRHKSRDSKCC